MSLLSERNSTGHKHAGKGTEVFVGGLPRSISEDKIQKVFSACGDIVEIRMVKDQKGNLKGFCFVRFSTKEAADRAVREKSGILIDGKKIGVLPSSQQDTLYFGNLNKAWTAVEFERLVLQVFPDIESINLAMVKDAPPGQKHQNRGFAFVTFSSHAAAVRAQRVGSQPDFRLGNVHPAIQWAEDEPGTDSEELAKIKVAFVRNLPGDAEENYLKQLFEPFGKVEKVVVSKKGSFPVGFVHFTERPDLERAVREMNEKAVQGPSGGSMHKLQVEVARPMDKNKKRVRDSSESNPSVQGHSKLLKEEWTVAIANNHNFHAQRGLESADPYEDAVIALPLAVKERLLRILRLGIATRFDLDVKSLCSLKELPEYIAITVLDQFMISGAASQNKGAYFAGLISKHLGNKLGPSPSAISLAKDASAGKESKPFSFSHQVSPPAIGSFVSHAHSTAARPDVYAPQYLSTPFGYSLSSRTLMGRLEEKGPQFVLSNPSEYPLSSRTLPRRVEEKSPEFVLSNPSENPLSSRTLLGREEEKGPEFAFPNPSEYPLSNRTPSGRVEDEGPEYLLSNRSLSASQSMHIPRIGTLEERSRYPYEATPGQSITSYGRAGLRTGEQYLPPVQPAPASSTYAARLGTSMSSVGDRQPPRPQIRFDPFTGEPYKFDPFTGEPIRPESITRQS